MSETSPRLAEARDMELALFVPHKCKADALHLKGGAAE